mgnify:CR=1 FL=1
MTTSTEEIKKFNKDILLKYSQKYGLKTQRPESCLTRLFTIAYGDGKIDPERLDNHNLIIQAIENPPSNSSKRIHANNKVDLMRFIKRLYTLKNKYDPRIYEIYIQKEKQYKSTVDISQEQVDREFDKLQLKILDNPTPESVQKYLIISLFKYCNYFDGYHLHNLVWKSKDPESQHYIDLENRVIVMFIKNNYIIIPICQKLHTILANLYHIIDSKYVLPDFHDKTLNKYPYTHKLLVYSIFGAYIKEKCDDSVIKVNNIESIPAIINLINENMELKKILINKIMQY